MKKGLCLLLLCAVLGLLCGCAKEEKKPADCKLLAEAVLAGQEFSPEMTTLSEKKMIKAIDLEEGEYAQAHMILDASRFTAEAIIAVTAADAKKAAAVEKKLTAYKDSVLEQYRTYRPEEVPKLEAAKVVRQGVQCVLVIAGDQQKAQESMKKVWEQ